MRYLWHFVVIFSYFLLLIFSRFFSSVYDCRSKVTLVVVLLVRWTYLHEFRTFTNL